MISYDPINTRQNDYRTVSKEIMEWACLVMITCFIWIMILHITARQLPEN